MSDPLLAFNKHVEAKLRELLDEGVFSTVDGLNRGLRVLAMWRSKLIEGDLVHRYGSVVLSGPFAGLRLRNASTEGCFAAKLLGCYEAQLHPYLIEAMGAGYEAVVDIGCAEGYYAVGLARAIRTAHVHAYDIDPAARAACREVAAINGVADRVTVGGEFRGEDFERFSDRRTLVIADIEGAEDELLDPARYPALGRMGIIVECHDGKRGLSEDMAGRFQRTHRVRRLDPAPSPAVLPAWFHRLGDLDQLLATWEWRGGPTPWLIMYPRT